MSPIGKTCIRIVTNINLRDDEGRVEIDFVSNDNSERPWDLFRRLRKADAIVMRLPSKYTALACLAARLGSSNRRLIYYDVNIPLVAGFWERLKRHVYLALVRQADCILTLHADTTEYASLLRIPGERLQWVGFKSNSWEDTEGVRRGEESADAGSYVLACGRSYRDFATFATAMAKTKVPARILLTQGDLKAEGSIPPVEPVPPNVTLVQHDGSRAAWLNAILGARIVVVPLHSAVIQPAGVSVYLEAMNLSRPVIVTQGPSTRLMLDDSIAGIVPPGDAEALAQETLRLWGDAALRASRIAKGREYVRHLGGVQRMSDDIIASALALVDRN